MSSTKGVFSKSLEEVRKEIFTECISCGNCIDECAFLEQTGEDPGEIAQRGPTSEEAYSCFLCGLCTQVCPSALNMKQMFNLKRAEAVENQEIDISEYSYLLPDRSVTAASLYREIENIDYTNLCMDAAAVTAFFPGCTMLTYAPGITTSTYKYIEKQYGETTMLTDCCGLPLSQMGAKERADLFIKDLKEKLQRLQIKTLITACPNCYYELKMQLADQEISIKTVYEILEKKPTFIADGIVPHKRETITIHDSCPDREKGVFGKQVREAFKEKGYSIVEMQHSQNHTLCCGSGGQVTHFQPDFSNNNMTNRVREAKKAQSDFLVSYCMACVLNFAMYSEQVKSQHALNFLLNVEEDFSGVKEKSRAIFTGPDGEKNWERLLLD